MNLPPEAQAIAERHAAEDRDLLARLRKEGKVQRRDGEFELRHPEVARPFVKDIERRVAAMRPGADTIRPNRKKQAKRSKRR